MSHTTCGKGHEKLPPPQAQKILKDMKAFMQKNNNNYTENHLFYVDLVCKHTQ